MKSNALPVEPADVLRRTCGREPLTLSSPYRLGLVCEGRVDLFVELMDAAGRPRGMRQHLVTLSPGEAFCIPASIEEDARLLAVGLGDAIVELRDDARRERTGLHAAESLDRWLEALTCFCAQGRPPDSTRVVQRGERLVASEGERIAAREPAWFVSEELAGPAAATHAGFVREKHSFGLATAFRAISPASGVTVQALASVDMVGLSGWTIIDEAHGELFREAFALTRADFAATTFRHSHKEQRAVSQVDGALRRLASLLDKGAGTNQAEEHLADARAVVARLCKAESILFPDEVSAEQAAADPITQVREILRSGGIRSRRVTLDQDWWRRDVGSFIGFHRESGRPVAVIRQGPTRFQAHSLDGNGPVSVDARVAGLLDTQAVHAYRRLPDHALGGLDLVRHVLASPARVDLRLAVLFAVMTAALGLLPPIIIGLVLGEAVPFSETSSLVMFGLGLVAIAVSSALFQVVRSIALSRLEAFADGTLQSAIWDRLLRLPLSFFRRFETGDLLIKAMAPTQLRKMLSDAALSSTLAALFAPVNFVLMMFYDVRLALAAGVLTLATCGVMFALSYRQLRFERTRLAAEAQVKSLTLQLLSGIKKIRLMGAENRSFVRWLEVFGRQRRQTQHASRVGNDIATLNRILPILAILVFIAVVGLGDTPIEPATFVAFAAAFGVFNAALLGFVRAVSVSLAVVPLYENMKPLLQELPEIDRNRRDPGRLGGRIDIRNVSFRYQEKGPLIIDGIDISIAPGEFVAFVGASGSGKSTLFRLLLGFELPQSGTVAYDGQDLAALDLKSVRRQIGVVLQRGSILPGSIFQNIVGSAPLTQEDAWEAALMAGLDTDIRDMPMGMHTVLSDTGGTLSGGQRQRLMIARAVVRRPGILLMDEATSALDNHTQAVVAKSLDEFSATRIVIAHRLSTVAHADRILVIDKGRVVQQGTFAQLMRDAGPFRDIALPQMQ